MGEKVVGLLLTMVFAYVTYRLYKNKGMKKGLRFGLMILTSIFTISSLIGPYTNSDSSDSSESTASVSNTTNSAKMKKSSESALSSSKEESESIAASKPESKEDSESIASSEFESSKKQSEAESSSISKASSESLVASSSSTKKASKTSTTDNASYTQNGDWTTAASGMVFVSDSNKYYTSVKNPGNYQYMTQSTADNSGAKPATRGNRFAIP